MTSTISRYGALTGPAAAVAFLGAFAASSASPPGVSSGGAATISFYRAHASGAHVSDALWTPRSQPARAVRRHAPQHARRRPGR